MLMGIDIGTTSVSIVVFDQNSRSITEVINFPNDSAIKDDHPFRSIQSPQKILEAVLSV